MGPMTGTAASYGPYCVVVATEQSELVYEGPGTLVGVLVQMLEQEGLTASYEAPMEQRGVGADLHTVILTITGAATTAALNAGTKAAIARFRERFPRAQVRGRHEAP